MAFFKKLMLMGVPVAGLSSIPFFLKSQSNAKTVKSNEDSEEEGDEEDKEEIIEEAEYGAEIDISEIKTTSKNDEEQLKIIKKAGLFCGSYIKDGKTCKVSDNNKNGIRLKVGDATEENILFSGSSTGKLVLRSNNNTYSYGLRFAVEGEDILLEKSGGAGEALTIQKLERFESFALEEHGEEGNKKLHLVRKKTAQQGVMNALGLPTSCALPVKEGTSTKCSLNYHNEIKNVHFDGRKRGGASGIVENIGGKKVNLTIHKTSDTARFKEEGYRFSFNPDIDLKISESDILPRETNIDYRVKGKWNEENMSLEKAWSLRELGEKVGLSCSNDECTINSGSLRVMQGNKKITGGHWSSGSGKIKVQREREAKFNNGFKFFIEGGDIGISGAGDSSVNKLSLYDGYEIVESNGEFYLNRKYEAIEKLLKLLNISCTLPNEDTGEIKASCSLPYRNHFEKIRFYAQGKEVSPSGNAAVDVKVYKANDLNTYKYGYRFNLKAYGEINIGDKTKLKENVAMDFKIREESGKLYLERAFDPEQLIEKVGLECIVGADQTETCTFQENKANVRHWDRNIKGATAPSQEGVGKLKLTRDQTDYTNGFKFMVEGGDITFNGGTKSGEDIRMGEFEEYEIKEENGTWFLNQKKNFMQQKHNSLGIQGSCNNAFSSPCEMEGMHVANNVNFKAKKGKRAKGQFSPSSPKVKFQMSKDTLYPFGIKVEMWVNVTDERKVSVVCQDNDSIALLQLTKDKTEFKIEKIDNNFYLAKVSGESNVSCTVPQAREE